jgi:hypothetical protein
MSASTITAKVTLDLAKAIKLDPTLTPAARLVGLFIADHLNTGRGFAWPSQDVIARELGIALRTVQRSMGVLRRHFEIMQRPGVVNEYRPAPRSIRRGYPRRNVGQPLSKCRVTPVKMSGYNDPSYYPLNDPLKQTSAGRASREMFSAFKEVYPKRSDQGWSAAEKHFNAAVRSGVDPNDVVQAARNYGERMRQEQRKPQHILTAKNWLRDQQWRDDLPTPADIEARARRETAARKKGYEWINDRWTDVKSTEGRNNADVPDEIIK